MLLQKSFGRIHWKSLTQPWQNVDWWLFILPIGLTILGGIMIRSVEMNQGWTDWRQHWITGGVGLIAALAIARWRYDQLIQWRWIIYGITIASLLAVMFIGRQELGAQRWINIFGFNLQPSEFAKLGIIVTIASLLSDRPAKSIPIVIRTLAIAAVPWIFVFLEPNLGTSLVFGAISLGMLYWGGANPGWLLLLLSPFLSAILFNVFLPIWFVWIFLIGFVAWRTLPWYRIGTFGAVVINLVSGH